MTIDFLRHVLPSEAGDRYFAAAFPNQGRLFHAWAATHVDLHNKVYELSGQGHETWYAMAAYQQPPTGGRLERKAQYATHVRSLWFDLDIGKDGGYETLEEGEQALYASFKAGRLPVPTYIVQSGSGLHVYWCYNQDVERDVWANDAGYLKAAIRQADPKFAVDLKRVGDAASIMRLPGSWNYKTNPPLPVAVRAHMDQYFYEPGAMAEAYKHLDPMATAVVPKTVTTLIPGKTPPRHKPTGLAHKFAEKPFAKPSFKDIIHACPLTRHYAVNAQDQSYDLWLGLLGVARGSAEGVAAAHIVSKRHPGYTEAQTTEKYLSLSSPGWTACETLRNALPPGSPDLCSGCRWHGEVKTPGNAAIKHASLPPETTQPKAETPSVAAAHQLPPGYKVGPSGTWLHYQNPETFQMEIQKIYDYGVTCKAVLVDDDKYYYVLEFVSTTGKYERTLPGENISTAALLKKWLATVGLTTERPGLLQRFFEMCQPIWIDEVEIQRSASKMGWRYDGSRLESFAVGERRIYPDRVVQNYALGSALTLAHQYQKHGTLDQWSAGAQALMGMTENYPQFMIGLLAGLASPLLVLSQATGGFISVHASRPGIGKSLSMLLSSTIYGAGKIRGANATNNSMIEIAGVLNNICLEMDEMTGRRLDGIDETVMDLGNGAGRSRLDQSGVLRPTAEFRLIALTSGNESVADRCAGTAASRAKLDRMLAMDLDSTPGAQLPDLDAGEQGDLLSENGGNLIEPYIQHVLQHQDAIAKRIRRLQREWIAVNPKMGSRFKPGMLACMQIAAEIVDHLKVVRMDPNRVKQVLQGTLDASVTEEQEVSQHSDIPSVLDGIIEHVMDNLLIVRDDKPDPRTDKEKPVRATLFVDFKPEGTQARLAVEAGFFKEALAHATRNEGRNGRSWRTFEKQMGQLTSIRNGTIDLYKAKFGGKRINKRCWIVELPAQMATDLLAGHGDAAQNDTTNVTPMRTPHA